MKNRWLVGAAAVLTVAGAVAAQGADLPTRKEAPAPVFVPPPFTWTGFYVGGNAGGIFGTGDIRSTVIDPNFGIIAANWPNTNFGSNSGFIGGGQAGYNWQTGAFVLGVETDFDGSSLSRSRTIIGPTFGTAAILAPNDFLTANGSIRLNWLGSTRARVGFVATPDNRLMLYGTGGFAYGGGSAHLNVYDAQNGWFWGTNGIYGGSNNNSQTRTGWVLGGGAEYALTNNWLIGAEYLYFNLGSKTFTSFPNVAAAAVFPNVYASTKVNFEGSVFRARVSYKF